MYETLRTLRFWDFVGAGWVRLALADGQTLQHTSGGPCDEGWNSTSTRWSRDGDTIERETLNEGRDCDGGYSHHVIVRANLVNLDANEAADDTIACPAWERVSASQRDEYAELAGY